MAEFLVFNFLWIGAALVFESLLLLELSSANCLLLFFFAGFWTTTSESDDDWQRPRFFCAAVAFSLFLVGVAELPLSRVRGFRMIFFVWRLLSSAPSCSESLLSDDDDEPRDNSRFSRSRLSRCFSLAIFDAVDDGLPLVALFTFGSESFSEISF